MAIDDCAFWLIYWWLHVKQNVAAAGSGHQEGVGDLAASERDHLGHMAESPGAAALYIAAFAEELARLAKTHGFEALAYLLDMARLEADDISKHPIGQAGRGAVAKD